MARREIRREEGAEPKGNREHIERIQTMTRDAWNEWRKNENAPDLQGCDLPGRDLAGYDLKRTILAEAVCTRTRTLAVADCISSDMTDTSSPHLMSVIPINDDLASILAAHRTWFLKEFGEPKPDHHPFPWGKPVPSDPVRRATDIMWGWDELRRDTGVRCSLHDLGHRADSPVMPNPSERICLRAVWRGVPRVADRRKSA